MGIVCDSDYVRLNFPSCHSKIILSLQLKLICVFSGNWSLMTDWPVTISLFKFSSFAENHASVSIEWIIVQPGCESSLSSVPGFFFPSALNVPMILCPAFLQPLNYASTLHFNAAPFFSYILEPLKDQQEIPVRSLRRCEVSAFRSGFGIGVLAGMLSFLLMAFHPEGDISRYKFDIEQYWRFEN